MKQTLATLTILFTLSAHAQKPDTVYYSIVGNHYFKGEQKVWKVNKNEYRYIYYFNDRGRGENVNETIRTNNDGQIISSTTNGVDYYKSPLTVNYSIKNDSAIWITNGIRKAQKYDDEIYARTISNSNDIILRWLLKKSNKLGFMIPHDTLKTIEPLALQIPFHDKKLSLKLCAFYFTMNSVPNYTWLSDDMNFFASVTPFSATILKGYESLTDTLLELQENADREFFVKQLKSISTPIKNHFYLTHCNLFVSSTATVMSNMTVEITQGRIASIFPSTDKELIGDTIINVNGKFLMPGLWDMHTHYGKEDGIWYIAGGVTHVRDMGSVEITSKYQRQIRAHDLIGPDISYLSLMIDREGPLQVPMGTIITTPDSAFKAIDHYHSLGWNQIKLYSSIKPEWVKPIAEHAHAAGMRVAGHVPAYMTAAQAIEAGYDEITHINMIMLNFLRADTMATNGIIRLRGPGEFAGKIDLNSNEVRSFIQLMKSKSISIDPTIHVFEELYAEYKNDTSKALKPIISWMPKAMREDIALTSGFGSDEQKNDYLKSYKKMQEMLKLMYDNGILIVAGTDGGRAISLHNELEIYTEAGIPPNEALKTATYNAAKDCGLEDKFGQLNVGSVADFILIDGNPAKDISDIRRVEWVVTNGLMYSPKKLYASQGWTYYY